MLPFAILLASTAVKVFNITVGALLTANDLNLALLAASTLLLALMSSGQSIQIGKLKLG